MKRQTTFKRLKKELNALGITITKKEGRKYQLNYIGGKQVTVCYAYSLLDAHATGLEMLTPAFRESVRQFEETSEELGDDCMSFFMDMISQEPRNEED